MAVHGKNTYVGMDNAAGSLVDIRAYLRDATQSRSIDTAESSNFGQNEKTYVVGLNDATLSVSGTFDTAFDLLVNAVLEAQAAGTLDTITCEYGPQGNVSGSPIYSAEYILTSYEVSGSTGDVVSASLEFQRTGATTRSLAP